MRFLTLPQTDFISLPSRETLATASFSKGINEQWSGRDFFRLTTHRLDSVVLTVPDVLSSLSVMVVLHLSSSFPHHQMHLQQLTRDVRNLQSEEITES